MRRRIDVFYHLGRLVRPIFMYINKPFIKWHYEPGLMKRREPYDRMVAIVERLIILLTTPEKH